MATCPQLKVQYHLDKTDSSDKPAVALYSGEKPGKAPQLATIITQINSTAVIAATLTTKTNNYEGSNNYKGSNNSNNTKTSSNYSKPAQNNVLTCTQCKINGHGWKECRKLKADNQRKKQFAYKKKNDNHTALMTQERTTRRVKQSADNTWIIDSGEVIESLLICISMYVFGSLMVISNLISEYAMRGVSWRSDHIIYVSHALFSGKIDSTTLLSSSNFSISSTLFSTSSTGPFIFRLGLVF